MIEVGDTLRIDYMEGESEYWGRTGKVEFIDDAGQIHTSCGGCALIPNLDKFTIIKKKDE